MNSPENKFLLYTFFRNGFTYNIARELEIPDINKIYVAGEIGAKRLCAHIRKHEYEFILGIGNYSRNAKKIRVEKIFQNKIGSNKVCLDGKKFYESNLFIPVFENMISSDKTTTGPCNATAYLIHETIEKFSLKSKAGFLHISRGLEKEKVKDLLEKTIRKILCKQI